MGYSSLIYLLNIGAFDYFIINIKKTNYGIIDKTTHWQNNYTLVWKI